MSVSIQNTNPIALTAILSAGPPYAVTVNYGASLANSILDTFTTAMPGSVTVTVTATSMPAGYHLAATGDGTWTTVSTTVISGVFTLAATLDFSFTVIITDGTTILAQHDPRLSIRGGGSR